AGRVGRGGRGGGGRGQGGGGVLRALARGEHRAVAGEENEEEAGGDLGAHGGSSGGRLPVARGGFRGGLGAPGVGRADELLQLVDRDGEVQVLRAAEAGDAGGGDADDLALHVEERPARVARRDGRRKLEPGAAVVHAPRRDEAVGERALE